MTTPSEGERIAEVLGQWQIIGIHLEHHPDCDGSCRNCPIPAQHEVTPTEAAEALAQAGIGSTREAAAWAWDEGYLTCFDDKNYEPGYGLKANPYRDRAATYTEEADQ